MQKLLKDNGVQIFIAAAASFLTVLSTLHYNDWVASTFSGSVVALLYWLGLCLLYRQAFRRLNVRLWWVCLAGSLLLSAFQGAGDMILAGFDYGWFFIRMAGYIPLFLAGLSLAFSVAEEWRQKPAKQIGGKGRAWLEKLLAGSRRGLLALAGLLVLCWLPYCAVNWPGLVSPDIKHQLLMWQGQLPFTSHHPVLHTAFLGLSVRLGQLLGNDAIGVGIGMSLQTVAMALAVSCALRQMARLGVSLAWRAGAFLFYGLFPVFGWYTTTLWKDIWLAAFSLLFYLVLVELCRTKAVFFRSKGRIACLAVSSLGLILSKNNGFYLFLIALLALVITQKGCRRQILAGLLAGTALWMAVEGPVYKALGVEKGNVREALSIPMLQIAKVVATDPGSISAGDEALIRRVLPYDELAELYNPHVSDSIKDEFDSGPFEQEPLRYLGLWLRMGLQSPGIYLYSFLEQTYGYWYPEVRYWIFSDETYIAPKLNEDGSFAVAPKDSRRDEVRTAWEADIQSARAFPGLSMLFSVGFAFWLLAAAALYVLYTRRWELLAPMALFLGVWLTCLASPVFAEYRYAYPAILPLPAVLGFAFGTRAGRPAAEK